jgi:hypothetical protein
MHAKPEFVRRFEDAWKEPLTRFPALFHRDGTLFQSGMDRPIRSDEIPAHQEAALSLTPDIRITPTHWAEHGSDVLIEWDARGTFRGSTLRWSGASRFTLRDGLVIEEVAYFDTFPLRIAADPSLGRGDLVAAGLTAD